MKTKIALFLSAVAMASIITGCESRTVKEPVSVTQTNLKSGNVVVYDYGKIKLHAYATGDALNNEAYIVESQNKLIGIELPSFTDGLETWKSYIETLNKPMNDIFLESHLAGGEYAENMTTYGTEGSKNSAINGAVFATTDGLYKAFGDDFHGGKNMAQINKVVSGTVTIDGVDFNLIDRGEGYDLEIPALNVIYTHMLGKNTHSILISPEYMDSMEAVLKEYQKNGYNMILSSHSTPEKQDAVTEKIAYLDKTRELLKENSSADEFISAMKKAFPDYNGENYLQMSAGYLYTK